MKRSCLSLFLLIALVALPSLAWAQSRSSVTWDSYNVEIAIQPNGDFIVTETQAISFNGTFSKAYREIPLDRTTGITDVQVGEPNRPYRQAYGVANSYSVSTTDAGTLRIDWWFPQTTNAQRTFIIRYRVHGGLRYYPGGDQLYWKAIYDNRAGPIRSARLSVTFPQDVPRDQLLATVYPGGLASGPDVPDPRTVQFSAQNVTAQTGLEVRVQFPHGLVQGSPPPWQATADAADHWNQDIRPILDFLALLVGLAIPVVGLVIVFLTWYTKGRDPRVSGVPEVLEQPPSDLPPGVAGTLVDEQADVQDVLATLLDLARRGIIQIQEEQNPELLGSSRDFVITQVQPNPIGLRAFERTVLAAVLPGGQPTRVSEMKGRFQAHIPLFRQQLFDEAVRAGLFNESPERSRQHYRAIALALLVLSLVGGIVSVILFGSRVDLIFVPFVGLGIVGLVLAWTSRRWRAAPGPGRWRRRAGARSVATWHRASCATATRTCWSATCPTQSRSGRTASGCGSSPRSEPHHRAGMARWGAATALAASRRSSSFPVVAAGAALDRAIALGASRTRQPMGGSGSPRRRTSATAPPAGSRAGATRWLTCSTAPPMRSVAAGAAATGVAVAAAATAVAVAVAAASASRDAGRSKP